MKRNGWICGWMDGWMDTLNEHHSISRLTRMPEELIAFFLCKSFFDGICLFKIENKIGNITPDLKQNV